MVDAAAAIRGFCDPQWEPVRQRFIENFEAGREVGASVCVYHEGTLKVDLAGGVADPKTATPWTEDTVSLVFSSTKGATALCAHVLISDGELDLHAPVSRYWPEFAQNGKDRVTIAMLLDHSAAVPGFREPIKPDAYLDWEYMVERLEQEEPHWIPGTRAGYHGATIGWTVGEVVRRVSGQSLGTFFRSEIAKPLGLDFWIGLPEEQEHRVSAMQAGDVDLSTLTDIPLMRIIKEEPDSLPGRAAVNTGGYFPGPGMADNRAYHAAELGGMGGITNARGLAGMYNPLSTGGGTILSEEHTRVIGRTSMASHYDAFTQYPTRYGLGYMKRMDSRHLPGGDLATMLLGNNAFGHPGAGGSIGFADPDCHLAFGYQMNKMGPSAIIDIRAQSMIDAAYRCATGTDFNA